MVGRIRRNNSSHRRRRTLVRPSSVSDESSFSRLSNSHPMFHSKVVNVSEPCVVVFGYNAQSTGAHEWNVSRVVSDKKRQFNCAIRKNFSWTCIVLGCTLCQSLVSILLYQCGRLEVFILYNAWTSNSMAMY